MNILEEIIIKYIHPSISCVYYLNDSTCPFYINKYEKTK